MTDELTEKALAEQRAMRKYAVLKNATEDVVSVQKSYIDITGDIPSALVLDELIFWTLPRKGGRSGLRSFHNGVLWLAVGRTEWWDRKRLTPNQADYAIEKLEKMGVIEKKIYKYEGTPRVHIRLLASKFFEMFAEAIQKSIPEGEKDEMLELADLYAMMGLDDTRFRKNAKSISENSEILRTSENSEILNSPHPSNTFSAPKRELSEKTKQVIAASPSFAIGADIAYHPDPELLGLEEIRKTWDTIMRINAPWEKWGNFDRWLLAQEREGRPVKTFCEWFTSNKFRRESVGMWTPNGKKQGEYSFKAVYPQAFPEALLVDVEAPREAPRPEIVATHEQIARRAEIRRSLGIGV